MLQFSGSRALPQGTTSIHSTEDILRKQRPSLEDQEHPLLGQPVIYESARFAAEHWLVIIAISFMLLIPCFWHHHIEAGDLGSHLYNAWLAQLIERGQAPGLWIANQHFNILFDLLVSGLARFFNFTAAEKMAVSICVLIFFWGVFAFASSISRRPAWRLIPLLAIIAYGWTFHVGFFNYYLSVGLSFWALAIFWRGRFWERVLAVLFAVPVLMAHPLGFCWLLGALIYVALAQRMPNHLQWLLLAASAAALFGVHLYLQSHAVTFPAAHSFYFYNGADQFAVFGPRYLLLAGVLGLFLVTILVMGLYETQRRAELLDAGRILLQLYLVVELAVLLLPDYVRSSVFQQPASVITPRLTLLSAVLAYSSVALVPPRRWHWIAATCLATVFFAFIFQDTARLAGLEDRTNKLLQSLPAGARVVSNGWKFPEARTLAQHFVDRACIGHCFNYANYEPASGQFRVRARAGNPFVTSALHFKDDADLHAGNYQTDVPPLPAYLLYDCPNSEDLCLAAYGTQPAGTR